MRSRSLQFAQSRFRSSTHVCASTTPMRYPVRVLSSSASVTHTYTSREYAESVYPSSVHAHFCAPVSDSREEKWSQFVSHLSLYLSSILAKPVVDASELETALGFAPKQRQSVDSIETTKEAEMFVYRLSLQFKNIEFHINQDEWDVYKGSNVYASECKQLIPSTTSVSPAIQILRAYQDALLLSKLHIVMKSIIEEEVATNATNTVFQRINGVTCDISLPGTKCVQQQTISLFHPAMAEDPRWTVPVIVASICRSSHIYNTYISTCTDIVQRKKVEKHQVQGQVEAFPVFWYFYGHTVKKSKHQCGEDGKYIYTPDYTKEVCITYQNVVQLMVQEADILQTSTSLFRIAMHAIGGLLQLHHVFHDLLKQNTDTLHNVDINEDIVQILCLPLCLNMYDLPTQPNIWHSPADFDTRLHMYSVQRSESISKIQTLLVHLNNKTRVMVSKPNTKLSPWLQTVILRHYQTCVHQGSQTNMEQIVYTCILSLSYAAKDVLHSDFLHTAVQSWSRYMEPKYIDTSNVEKYPIRIEQSLEATKRAGIQLSTSEVLQNKKNQLIEQQEQSQIGAADIIIALATKNGPSLALTSFTYVAVQHARVGLAQAQISEFEHSQLVFPKTYIHVLGLCRANEKELEQRKELISMQWQRYCTSMEDALQYNGYFLSEKMKEAKELCKKVPCHWMEDEDRVLPSQSLHPYVMQDSIQAQDSVLHVEPNYSSLAIDTLVLPDASKWLQGMKQELTPNTNTSQWSLHGVAFPTIATKLLTKQKQHIDASEHHRLALFLHFIYKRMWDKQNPYALKCIIGTPLVSSVQTLLSKMSTVMFEDGSVATVGKSIPYDKFLQQISSSLPNFFLNVDMKTILYYTKVANVFPVSLYTRLHANSVLLHMQRPQLVDINDAQWTGAVVRAEQKPRKKLSRQEALEILRQKQAQSKKVTSSTEIVEPVVVEIKPKEQNTYILLEPSSLLSDFKIDNYGRHLSNTDILNIEIPTTTECDISRKSPNAYTQVNTVTVPGLGLQLHALRSAYETQDLGGTYTVLPLSQPFSALQCTFQVVSTARTEIFLKAAFLETALHTVGESQFHGECFDRVAFQTCSLRALEHAVETKELLSPPQLVDYAEQMYRILKRTCLLVDK